ncbi:hypothetical protein ABQE44_13300 [Mycolicibacterium sp. XJ2546]
MATKREVRPPQDAAAPKSKARTKWTRASEVLISALVIVIVLVGVVGSLPKSAIKSTAAPVVTPIARASGLDQSWGVFSPNPPRIVTELEVHVVMSDGEDRLWRLDADRSLPEYRWRKLKEAVIKHKGLRRGFAQWVVSQVTNKTDKVRPAQVLIIMQTETLPLPGKGEPKKVRKLLYNGKVARAK